MSSDSRAARLENRNRLSKEGKTGRRDLNKNIHASSLDFSEPSPDPLTLEDATRPDTSPTSLLPSSHNTSIEPSLMATSSATIHTGSRDLAMPEDSVVPTIEGDPSAVRAAIGRKDKGGDNSLTYERDRNADRDMRVRQDDGLTYTKTQWKKDAMFLQIAIQAIEKEDGYEDYSEDWTNSDKVSINALARTLDSAKREEYQDLALKKMASTFNPLSNRNAFRALIRQYRKGPSLMTDPEAPEKPASKRRDHQRSDSNDRYDDQYQRPPRSPRRSRQITRDRSMSRDRRELDKAEEAARRIRERMSRRRYTRNDDNQSERSRSSGRDRSDRRRQTRDSSRRYRDEVDEDDDDMLSRRRTKVTPSDIGKFDPQKGPVSVFIKRIEQLVEIFGKETVLMQLPLCLQGEALEWHTSLNRAVSRQMQRSLSSWIEQLERRFKVDRFEARDTADQLKFRFANQNSLNLRQYVTKKTNLLEEAGIFDSDEVVERVWKGLDPVLMATVSPYEAGNSLDEFTTRLYRQEGPAKRWWEESSSKQGAASGQARTRSSGYKDGKYLTSSSNRSTKQGSTGAMIQQGRFTASLQGNSGLKPGMRPCRHCGGQHMDNVCPTSKKAQPVRAFYVDPDDSEEEEREVHLDEETLAAFRRLQSTPITEDEENQEPAPENESSGC